MAKNGSSENREGKARLEKKREGKEERGAAKEKLR